MITLVNTQSDVSDSQLVAEIRQSSVNLVRSIIVVVRHSRHSDLPDGSLRDTYIYVLKQNSQRSAVRAGKLPDVAREVGGS